MKNNLFVMATLAVLATACVKEQQPTDQTPADVEKTVLAITVDPTKAAVDETGGAVNFQTGDELAVWFQTGTEITGEGENAKETAVGTRVVFTYVENNEDGSAKFETEAANVPEEFSSAKAAYPATSLDAEGAFSLVRNYTYTPGSVPVYVRSENVVKNEDGKLSAQLSHNASIFKFTLHDIPAYAAGFVLETTKNAGEDIIAIKTTFPYKTGYTADPADQSNDIVLHSPAAHSSYVSRVYLVDGDGDEIEGSEIKFKKANLVGKGDYIIMPRIDFKKSGLREDYVKVAGVKWAKGNLQCYQNNGDAGFQDGWRLAPYQWHHFNYDLKTSTISKVTYTYDDTKATEMRYENSSTQFEHFNFGALARNSRFYSAPGTNYMVPGRELDISGKIYTDSAGNTEATGDARFVDCGTFTSNNSAIWGDLAFWASNGTLRTPSADEFATLYAKASRTAAVYTYEGVEVKGTYFFDPAAGTDPVVDTENIKTLVSADLAVGLFLPHTGRTYAANDYKLYAVNSIGVYRTTTVNLNSTLEATNGVIYRVSYIQESEKNSKGLYGSFYHSGWGANGRYAIRPVKVK